LIVAVYEDYKKLPGSLTFKEMEEMHAGIAEEIGDDPDSLELYGELLKKAGDYLSIRNEWRMLSLHEKCENDGARTVCHDSVLICIKALSRCLRSRGKAVKWLDTLGDLEKDPGNRRRWGDFACYLAFINSVNGR